MTQLRRQVQADRLHPMLFTGGRGLGKRTAALWLAQAANCQAGTAGPCGRCSSCLSLGHLSHPDIRLVFPIRNPKGVDPRDADRSIELVSRTTIERYPEFVSGTSRPGPDPRQTISIWQIRWLRREMARPPMLARRRFFILLHADMMRDEAANALLKALEEPSPRTTWILTSECKDRVASTISSRCHTVRFSPVPGRSIREWLIEEKGAEPAQALVAAEVASGSPGLALEYLDHPESHFSRPAADFFAHADIGEAEVRESMTQVEQSDLDAAVDTLLFLHREALRVKLGLDSPYADADPSVRARAALTTVDWLRRAIKYLVSRLRDSELNVNRNLYLYTLLSSLRSPDRSRQGATSG